MNEDMEIRSTLATLVVDEPGWEHDAREPLRRARRIRARRIAVASAGSLAVVAATSVALAMWPTDGGRATVPPATSALDESAADMRLHSLLDADEFGSAVDQMQVALGLDPSANDNEITVVTGRVRDGADDVMVAVAPRAGGSPVVTLTIDPAAPVAPCEVNCVPVTTPENRPAKVRSLAQTVHIEAVEGVIVTMRVKLAPPVSDAQLVAAADAISHGIVAD